MPFLPETWKAKVTERLWEGRLRVEQARPAAIYSALSTVALWPLAGASSHNERVGITVREHALCMEPDSSTSPSLERLAIVCTAPGCPLSRE